MPNGHASSPAPLGDECYRVGLLGLGHIVQAHVEALHGVPGFRIAAVCDREPARVGRWAAATGCRGFTDTEAFLASPIDIAVVLLPHHLHAPMATRALKAGLHVVVEKPMATSPDDCSLMIDAAEAADRMLLVADTAEFVPGVLETGRRYRDGSLGRLLTGSTVMVRRYFTPDRPAWFLDPACSGGGMFANVGVHRLAMTRTAVPGLQPSDVMATVHRLPGRPVEACTAAMVRYADGASMQYQEIGHVITPPWLRTGTHLLFEHGLVGWDEERWYYSPTTGESAAEPLPPQSGYVPLYDKARRLLRSGSLHGHARGPAQDVAIVAAAYQSAELGRAVSIDSLRTSAEPDACLTNRVSVYH